MPNEDPNNTQDVSGGQNQPTEQQNNSNINNNTAPTAQSTNGAPSNPPDPANPSNPASPLPTNGNAPVNQPGESSHTAVQNNEEETEADKDAAGTPLVHGTDIEKVVSRWTGIPITKLTEKESEKLLHMEDLIHKNFINHERAVTAVAEAIRRGRIGLASASRPIASFIFLGPTGTGKTELAKVLAEIMFGKKDAMIRLDMSEYMEKHEVAKLVGAPPGYVGYEEGGQLTEAVRAKPYSIVLLDEIEKAHPDVFNILLQLLEDGRLTDNKGNTISFKNTVIIATSNIGSQLIQQKLQELKSGPAPTGDIAAPASPPVVNGTPSNPAAVPATPADPNSPQTTAQTVTPVQPGATSGETLPNPSADLSAQPTSQPVTPSAPSPIPAGPANSIVTQTSGDDSDPETQKHNKIFKELSSIVMEELTKHFRPELINRFDEVVIFEPLSQDNMMQIAKLGIEGTKKMLQEQGIDLQISEAALAQLAKEGYDPSYGARPLRRLIQRSIENPIAIYLIERSAGKGDTIMIDYDNSKDAFTFTKQGGQGSAASAPATQPSDPMSPSGGNTPPNPSTPSNLSDLPSDLPIDEAPPVVPPPGDQPPPVPPPQDGAGQAKQLPEWLDQVTENAQGTGTGTAPEELVDAGAGTPDNTQTTTAGGAT